MRKAFLTVFAALTFAGVSHASDLPQPPTDYSYGSKSDSDACGATLCLLGMTRDGDCNKYVTKYFSIIRTKHGKFSPRGLLRPVAILWRSALKTRAALSRRMTSGGACNVASKFSAVALAMAIAMASPLSLANQAPARQPETSAAPVEIEGARRIEVGFSPEGQLKIWCCAPLARRKARSVFRLTC